MFGGVALSDGVLGYQTGLRVSTEVMPQLVRELWRAVIPKTTGYYFNKTQ